MRMHLEDGLAVGWTIHSFKAGERSACFAIKSTYQLQNGAGPVLADEPAPPSGDQYVDDDAAKCLLYPSDFAPFKPRADVLLLATAHAPDQQPSARFNVLWKVGGFGKSLTISGDRELEKGLLRSKPGAPKPFLSMPISYERSWGGPKNVRNPLGRSGGDTGFPNIEDPRTAASMRADIDPAGYGPIPPGWQQRASQVGTYDKKWLAQRWPWFPADFDYGYFNAAPRDQRIEGYLKGDEELRFENLHPVHALYQSRLPGLRNRCFLHERGANNELSFREVPLVLDTLWLNLNEEKMILVWRGQIPVRTIKLKEIEQILAWTEPLAEPPRPASYCPLFLAARQRAEDVENEVASPEEVAAKEAEKAAADAKFEKRFAEFDKEMAEGDQEITALAAALEEQWTAEKAALIASGADPALLEAAASQSPSEALRASIQSMQGTNPEEAARLQQQLADVEQLEAEEAAMDKEFAAEFPPKPTRDDVLAAIARRESLAERDLMEMDLSGQDLSGIDCRAASFRNAKLKGANLRKANLKEADLSEADLSDADLTQAILDDADLSEAILTGAKLTGLSLSGTDLSGQNLAGADFMGSVGKSVDFSGADLTKAQFIGVKLPGADFSKSKLGGADFRYAEISRADLDGAKAKGIILEGADLTGASVSDGADFTEGNFIRAKAAGAVFSEALLDRANFSRAILARAQFPDASLIEAVLDRADLSSAVFDGAVLRKAVMSNANLIRASFDQADLAEANLTGSNLYEAGFWEAILDGAVLRNANVKGTTLV